MKNCIALAAVFIAFTALTSLSFGQKPARGSVAVSASSVELGGRVVRIPVPDRFTDSMLHFPRVAARLIAAESPMNEVLAVHVTDEAAPALRDGQDPDLPFYTKVSILKEFKCQDIGAEEFQALAVDLERMSPGTLQATVKDGEKGMSDRLTEHWGSDAALKIGEARMLGHFDKQPQSISSMFVMNVEMFGRKLIVLGSMSMVHVNRRVLFLYVFRIPSGADDLSAVAATTKAWTAKTIAANR